MAWSGADNIVYEYTGITPVEIIESSPIICVYRKNGWISLKELDMALDIKNIQDVFYLETLRNKYSADSAVSVFLSAGTGMDGNTPKVKIGYLEHYMPDTVTQMKKESYRADRRYHTRSGLQLLPGQA